MHPWTANLIGVALGLSIGGAGLAVLLPSLEAPAPPPSQAPAVQPAPVARPARPLPVVVRPAQAPQVVAALPLQPDEPLPSVIYPASPDEPTSHKPGTAIAGTGFFVASDATLITAAHVVPGCRLIRIGSRYVKMTAAEVLARDKKNDIALLRAPHVTPPALLSFGRPAEPSGQLFVLGYPASGGMLVPTEAWGALENGRMQPWPGGTTDPKRMIWIDAPVVTHGFSGGPMLDPRNGAVVGIVKAGVTSKRVHPGTVIGPGSSMLAALLDEEGTDSDALPLSGDDALDAARHATVHVICVF